MVAGEQDQLVQVFLNLVKNAVEAMEGQSTKVITLSSAYRSGMQISSPSAGDKAVLPLEFSVTDNGKGIPVDIRRHIFDPFVTTRLNGSGLGLALVAKIVGKHGGIVECDSNHGQTVFRVLLSAWNESKAVSKEAENG